MINLNKKFIYKYWSYEICQNLDTLTDKNIETFKPKGRFYDDAVALYEILTISPHPAFNSLGTVDPNIIIFDNTLIDINTLKIMFYLLPFTKIVTLKFSKASFEFSNLEYLINCIMTKPNNVISLFFDWISDIRSDGKIIKNPETIIDYSDDNQMNDNILDDNSNVEKFIPNHQKNNINNTPVQEVLLKSKLLLAKLSSQPKLDSLCLRGCYIGDAAAAIIFENLKVNNTLRVINLFKCSLTSKSAINISNMIEINRKLEELNIGGNLLTNDDFRLISSQVGKVELNDEEIESYNKKLKEKNEILEKNKKQKAAKKPEFPVPVFPEIEVIGERYFATKNGVIKTLNFMQNNLLDKSLFGDVLKILEKTEEMLIILDMKIFDKSERDKLADPKNRYTSKVYLAK